MKIIDLKCAVIGNNPIVRIATDEGIIGYGSVESYKPYLKPWVLDLAPALIGEDPTNVENVMLRIRKRGSFKPWGAAVSSIEMALWDLAGKAAGVPVYKLLGGKVRDQVRVYNGSVKVPVEGTNPEDYAARVKAMKELPHGFSIVKVAIAFHSDMRYDVDQFTYGDIRHGNFKPHPGFPMRGLLTEKGLNHCVDCIVAMKDVLGTEVGLAIDCGPGWALPDAIRFAQAVEPYNLMWLEDMLTGDYTPWVNWQEYRDLTVSTSTPIHTGEQVYLRHNFKDLIENNAVRIVGPDPCDVGGIAELKWVAEFADMHGILMAPHGTGNGVLGMAALVNVACTLPQNYIAFEYPSGDATWWNEIVEGLPDPIVRNGRIEVWDRPGMGIDLIPEAAKQYLKPEDLDFFD